MSNPITKEASAKTITAEAMSLLQTQSTTTKEVTSLFSTTDSNYKTTDGCRNSPKSESLTSLLQTQPITQKGNQMSLLQTQPITKRGNQMSFFIFKSPNFPKTIKKAKVMI